MKEIAEKAGAAVNPSLDKENFPTLHAAFPSLLQLTFKGVKLHEPLVNSEDPDGDCYTVQEYLGTAWAPGDAVLKDEIADFTKAVYHFLVTRFRLCKGAPRQGGIAAGHQTVDTAGVEARKLVKEMGVVFDLRTFVVPLDPAAIATASASLKKIYTVAKESGAKLAAIEVLEAELNELRQRIATAACSGKYSERDKVVELRGGTTVEEGEGWFTSAGKVKSGTMIMKERTNWPEGKATPEEGQRY